MNLPSTVEAFIPGCSYSMSHAQKIVERLITENAWDAPRPGAEATLKTEFDGDTQTFDLYLDGKFHHSCWSTNEARAWVAENGCTWKDGQVPGFSHIPRPGSPQAKEFLAELPPQQAKQYQQDYGL